MTPFVTLARPSFEFRELSLARRRVRRWRRITKRTDKLPVGPVLCGDSGANEAKLPVQREDKMFVSFDSTE